MDGKVQAEATPMLVAYTLSPVLKSMALDVYTTCPSVALVLGSRPRGSKQRVEALRLILWCAKGGTQPQASEVGRGEHF